MEVILAGYNIDGDLLARLRRSLDAASRDPRPAGSAGSEAGSPELPSTESLSPETLSAAYARASRDPRPLPELRREACSDVAAARRSNRRIIFGFGHASVAEHAVFNLDILGISRLAVEAVEATRLGSYTEKSQRYILLDRDCAVPAELAGGPLEAEFRELLDAQQIGYRRAFDALIEHLQSTRPAERADPERRALLEGSAKEDARYFLGLSTTGQLGATWNARSLEATVRRLASSPLTEVRELAGRIHAAVAELAPSLVRYTDPPACLAETPRILRARIARLRESQPAAPPQRAAPAEPDALATTPAVRLIDCTPRAEERLLAALLHGHGDLSWEEATELLHGMDAAARARLLAESLERHGVHDAPPREFEIPELVFELVVSASCFAQLKRHRMATLLPQEYDPRLGTMLPASFAAAGASAAFDQVRRQAERLHEKIRKAAHASAGTIAGEVAAYALTNAHRRRVLFKANARELYQFARLRLDEHAQWDIRAVAGEMIRQAHARMPLVMALACGKDAFAATRARLHPDA